MVSHVFLSSKEIQAKSSDWSPCIFFLFCGVFRWFFCLSDSFSRTDTSQKQRAEIHSLTRIYYSCYCVFRLFSCLSVSFRERIQAKSSEQEFTAWHAFVIVITAFSGCISASPCRVHERIQSNSSEQKFTAWRALIIYLFSACFICFRLSVSFSRTEF